MKKVVIIGSTGSGKTFFGEMLSKKLLYPVVDLDNLYWQPGWQLTLSEEFASKTSEITSKDAWILTGNYGQLRDIIWGRADTVIWLDYSFRLVFWRLLNRSLKRTINKQPICNGNTETWRRFLSKNSIFVWLLKSYWKKRHEYNDLFSDNKNFPHAQLIRLRTPHETIKFFQQIKGINQ